MCTVHTRLRACVAGQCTCNSAGVASFGFLLAHLYYCISRTRFNFYHGMWLMWTKRSVSLSFGFYPKMTRRILKKYCWNWSEFALLVGWVTCNGRMDSFANCNQSIRAHSFRIKGYLSSWKNISMPFRCMHFDFCNFQKTSNFQKHINVYWSK